MPRVTVACDKNLRGGGNRCVPTTCQPGHWGQRNFFMLFETCYNHAQTLLQHSSARQTRQARTPSGAPMGPRPGHRWIRPRPPRITRATWHPRHARHEPRRRLPCSGIHEGLTSPNLRSENPWPKQISTRMPPLRALRIRCWLEDWQQSPLQGAEKKMCLSKCKSSK